MREWNDISEQPTLKRARWRYAGPAVAQLHGLYEIDTEDFEVTKESITMHITSHFAVRPYSEGESWRSGSSGLTVL